MVAQKNWKCFFTGISTVEKGYVRNVNEGRQVFFSSVIFLKQIIQFLSSQMLQKFLRNHGDHHIFGQPCVQSELEHIMVIW